MRVLLTATMAASALAIGLSMDAAQALPPSGKIANPDSAVQQVQQQEKGQGPGAGGQGPSMGGTRKGGGPSMQGPTGGGAKMRESGGMRQGGSQFRAGEGARREGGAQLGERSMRQGGAQLRERSTRQGGTQFRSTERGVRGGRGGVEFGYTERRGRAYGPRVGERSRVYIERGREGYRYGRRGGAYIGPSYGYLAGGCGWLHRRALDTGSPYWWRRYRACRGGY